MTDLEIQMRKRWADWLARPRNADRFFAAIRKGDFEESKRLVSAAIAVDYPGWAKTIERANS